MKYLVVATPEELELPEAFLSKRRKIVTGVGGVNVFRALDKLSRNADILNVGYAGSQWYAKGTPVRIGTCRLYHPNCEYKEPSFTLDTESDALCLTAGDFVTGGLLPARSVVDMELAYIAAMGFRVKAVKYVSDNLNYEEYEKQIASDKREQRIENR